MTPPPEPKADAAFHLRGDHVRIDRRAAIDCADDAIDLDVPVPCDRHFGDLRDIGAKCFGDRNAQLQRRRAPAQRRWHRTTCSSAARPPGVSPIFLQLALNGRRRRIFDLKPIVNAAGAIGRAEAFGDDTLASQGAGVLKDDGAVAIEMFVEGNAVIRFARRSASARLRSSSRARRRS